MNTVRPRTSEQLLKGIGGVIVAFPSHDTASVEFWFNTVLHVARLSVDRLVDAVTGEPRCDSFPGQPISTFVPRGMAVGFDARSTQFVDARGNDHSGWIVTRAWDWLQRDKVPRFEVLRVIEVGPRHAVFTFPRASNDDGGGEDEFEDRVFLQPENFYLFGERVEDLNEALVLDVEVHVEFVDNMRSGNCNPLALESGCEKLAVLAWIGTRPIVRKTGLENQPAGWKITSMPKSKAQRAAGGAEEEKKPLAVKNVAEGPIAAPQQEPVDGGGEN